MVIFKMKYVHYLLLSHRFEKPAIDYVGTSCFDRLAIALHFYWITHTVFLLIVELFFGMKTVC